MAQSLIIIGAAIFGILGLVHLMLTFFSDKFEAHNSAVSASMKSERINITKETTIWKAWVGFNASHSLGAILIALIFIPLVIQTPSVVMDSLYYLSLLALYSAVYLFLAVKYWFKVPVIGFAVAGLCFWASLALSVM